MSDSLLASYSHILPNAEETLLLRAGLLSDNAARAAWQDWRAHAAVTFIGNHPTVRNLRPLLFEACQKNALAMDKASRTFLRLSYFKEELRRDIYRRICRQVLDALRRADIPVIVLKGAALADTVYAKDSIRHCHDIDLLLLERDLARAYTVLKQSRFHGDDNKFNAGCASLKLEHESGLPVELHTQLFQSSVDNVPLTDMRQRCRQSSIAEVAADILTPADLLLHVCGHASCSASRQSLRWVIDACRVIEKYGDLDWELLLDTARRFQLTLPLTIMFKYLAEAFGSAIPANVLDRLAVTLSDSGEQDSRLALRRTGLND